MPLRIDNLLAVEFKPSGISSGISKDNKMLAAMVKDLKYRFGVRAVVDVSMGTIELVDWHAFDLASLCARHPRVKSPATVA